MARSLSGVVIVLSSRLPETFRAWVRVEIWPCMAETSLEEPSLPLTWSEEISPSALEAVLPLPLLMLPVASPFRSAPITATATAPLTPTAPSPAAATTTDPTSRVEVAWTVTSWVALTLLSLPR